MTEYVTPNIHSVLKKYQNSAPKSLQGPGHALAAAAAANCLLDAAIVSDAIGSIGGVSSGSCEVTGMLLKGGIVGSSKCQPQLPAAHKIKKEVLSSPEPNELNDHQSVPLNTATAGTVAAVVVTQPPPPQIYPPPPPELSQPILSMADSCSGELFETRLEGKTIGCFSLGGEMRLCLPQFLNNVLADFTLEQINRIFDELGIFCSQCTPDQLIEFKDAKILPSDVKASGLITRTDAERLCAALLHRSDRNSYIPVESLAKGALSFRVYHKCFGKCEGICTPDMYSYQKPTCIKCLECDGWFSPQKFVGHVHRQFENRTCHWGFDSRNWHDYLHVALDVESREKYQRILDELKEVEIKETFKVQRELDFKKRKMKIFTDDQLGLGFHMGQHEQTHGLMTLSSQQGLTTNVKHHDEVLDIPTKKHKSLDETTAYQLDIQRYQSLMYAHCVHQQRVGQMSAFRPWGSSKSFIHAYNASAVAALSTLPYLSQEPPVLQNPERVVLSTDRERFEHTYQPNVALAPRKSILTKEREKEQRELRDRERLDREREREIERQRQRERSRERDIEKVVENDREKQRDLQQHNHLQKNFTVSDIKETEVHIKQERANTPADIPSTPPLLLTKNNNEDLLLERSNAIIDEITGMPHMNSLSLTIGQHQHDSGSSNVSQSLTQSLHTSISTSASLSASSTSTEVFFTSKQQKFIPAHQRPSVSNQCQTQPSQTQPQTTLQHLPLEQSKKSSPPSRIPPPSHSSEEYSANSTETTISTSPTIAINISNAKEKCFLALNTNHSNAVVTVNQHSKLLPFSTAPPTIISSNSNSNNELPSRIRINKNLINSPNIIRSPTPPTATATNPKTVYVYYKQQQQPTLHQETTLQRVSGIYQQQLNSPTNSSSTGLNLSTNVSSHTILSNTNAINQNVPTSSSTNNSMTENRKHQISTKPYMGSEFELSTDTDDDSLNDELNSNRMLPPWEMAVDALRDTRPRDRERILHLLQRLMQENQQFRYNNIQLTEILHKRDTLIMELRDELHHCRCELEHFLCERHHERDNASGGEHNAKQVICLTKAGEKHLRETLKRPIRKAAFNENQIENNGNSEKELTFNCEMKSSKKLRIKRQHYEINNVERRGQSPLSRHNENNCGKHFKLKQKSIDVKEHIQSIGNDHSDRKNSTELIDPSVKNLSPASVAKQQHARGNISLSIEDAGDEESRQSHLTATEGSDESPNEESADEEETNYINNNVDQRSQNHTNVSNSNVLSTPPTTSSPISTESTTNAGKLFDSSNSSDELSMKKAQISASNALAKMSCEETTEPDDERTRSENGENLEGNNKGVVDDGANEVPLQRQEQQKQARKAVTAETVKHNNHCLESHHLKERTNYINNCEYTTVTSLQSLPRTLTLQTKASKKQTPTTNCELQIKEEIV